VPHGVFVNVSDENVFQNPQIFGQTLSISPEQSTLGKKICGSAASNWTH
jgi:hypothetical protein